VQLYGPHLKELKALGEYIASKHFREPPVFIVFSGISVVASVARAVGDMRQSGSPPGGGLSHAAMTCHHIEDEDDWLSPCDVSF